MIIIAYAAFINELAPINICYEPLVLTLFVYLRGFTSVRTNISVAFFLLSLSYLYKKKYIKMLIFEILCLGMHIATFLFVPFLDFIFYIKRKNLRCGNGLRYME